MNFFFKCNLFLPDGSTDRIRAGWGLSRVAQWANGDTMVGWTRKVRGDVVHTNFRAMLPCNIAENRY